MLFIKLPPFIHVRKTLQKMEMFKLVLLIYMFLAEFKVDYSNSKYKLNLKS